MADLNKGTIDMKEVRKKLAPDFVATFRSLLSVMSIQEIKEREKRAKEESQSSSQVLSGSTSGSVKRPPPSPLSSAPKRIKSSGDSPTPSPEPRTPDQPTHPSDPDLTGESIESKDEENTKKLLFQFLMDTLSVLEDDFQRIAWQRSGCRVELNQT
jgi:hypothetical protein